MGDSCVSSLLSGFVGSGKSYGCNIQYIYARINHLCIYIYIFNQPSGKEKKRKNPSINVSIYTHVPLLRPKIG